MLRVWSIGSCLSLTLLAACGSQPSPPGPTFAYVLGARLAPWRTVHTAYRVDGSTGAWNLVGTVPPGAEADLGFFPGDVAFASLDPRGRFLYASLAGDNTGCSTDHCGRDRNVVTYGIDPSMGALSKVSTRRLFLVQPAFITVHPSGRFLLLDEYPSCSIGTAAIDAMTGALGDTISEVSCGGEYELEQGDDWVVVEPTGHFVYYGSCHVGAAVPPAFGYQTDVETGSLRYLGQWTAGRCVAVDPTGRHLYGMMPGTGPSGQVAQFDIDGVNGSLTAIGRTPLPGIPGSLVVHPSGHLLYLASGSDIWAYRLDDAGVPSPIRVVASGVILATYSSDPTYSYPASTLSLDPAGRFLYVLRPGDVLGYLVNATTGDLQPISQAEGGRLGTVAAWNNGIGYAPWIGLVTPH
jgi:6-phosphogluconolactonase